MRNVLLSLTDPPAEASIANFQAVIGRVYEAGDKFNPLEPTDHQASTERPTADLLIHTDTGGDFAFRPWHPSNSTDLDLWGIMLDINETLARREPVCTEVHKSAVETIAVGSWSVLAGLHFGVVSRIVKAQDIRVIPRTIAIPDREAVLKALKAEHPVEGLKYEPFFDHVNAKLAAVFDVPASSDVRNAIVSGPTTIYSLTAQAFREHKASGNPFALPSVHDLDNGSRTPSRVVR